MSKKNPGIKVGQIWKEKKGKRRIVIVARSGEEYFVKNEVAQGCLQHHIRPKVLLKHYELVEE